MITLFLILLIASFIAIVIRIKNKERESQEKLRKEGNSYYSHHYNYDEGYFPIVEFIILAFLSVAILILAIFEMSFITQLSTAYLIDDKITMYQEENSKIEEDIKIVVENYIRYENDTLTSLLPEAGANNSAYINVLASLPELNSKDLVKEQIDVYTQNRNKIKSLKESKIDAEKYKWYLYFGK